MGGMPSLKGWHVRNKNRSMVLDVRKESVSIHWNLIADPLELKSARTIEFYLQATPVKPKNIAALALRDGRNTVMWTGYWSRFYEMQDPAFLNYEKIRQLRRTDKKLFYYATAKGVSCYSPDWNYFGKYWISSPPRLGEYQIDSDVSSREKRDRNTYTYGCLNCRSFLDYKVGSLARMIALDALDMHNVYFDIAWPRSCDNTEHGCGWVDEFGQHQTTFDIAGTREFYLRAYKLLRRKYPDAMFAGHLTSTRTPADSFSIFLYGGRFMIGRWRNAVVISMCSTLSDCGFRRRREAMNSPSGYSRSLPVHFSCSDRRSIPDSNRTIPKQTGRSGIIWGICYFIIW